MPSSPIVVNYDSMTPEQRTEYSFRQLCHRLVDIDDLCNAEKGCPFIYAASPMIVSWRKTHGKELPTSLIKIVRQMVSAGSSGGRSCEFNEIKQLANQFLDTE